MTFGRAELTAESAGRMSPDRGLLSLSGALEGVFRANPIAFFAAVEKQDPSTASPLRMTETARAGSVADDGDNADGCSVAVDKS